MKIRSRIRVGLPAALAMTALMGCGAPPESVYDEELKKYGQDQSADATGLPGGQQPIEQPITPSGLPLPLPFGDGEGGDDSEDASDLTDSSDGETDGAADDADPTDGGEDDAPGDAGDDGADQADSQEPNSGEDDGPDDGGDGVIIGDDGEDDGSVIDPPDPIAPDTLISSTWYRAFFDKDSAQGIEDDFGTKELGQIETQVKDKLTNVPTDGLVISQTFGDGISTSLNSQDIFNSAGDTNRAAGADTVSGTQFMDRLVTAACPSPYLCITRMWFVPLEGEPTTYCFRDPVSGASAPYPYGPLPNYLAADFEPYYGTYGPYRVTKHAGEVACDTAGPALITEDVKVTVAPQTVTDTEYSLHIYEPLDPQYGISFRNQRVSNDIRSPYIDETVKLNTKSLYVMNEDASQITKMVVTSRQTIDVAAEAGGGVFGRFIANLVNIQGIIVDLHFELCTDLLAEGGVPHCEPPYGPPE